MVKHEWCGSAVIDELCVLGQRTAGKLEQRADSAGVARMDNGMFRRGDGFQNRIFIRSSPTEIGNNVGLPRCNETGQLVVVYEAALAALTNQNRFIF